MHEFIILNYLILSICYYYVVHMNLKYIDFILDVVLCIMVKPLKTKWF